MLRLKQEAGPRLSRVGQKQYGSSISTSVLSVSCAGDVDMCGGSVRDSPTKHEDCLELWLPQRLTGDAVIASIPTWNFCLLASFRDFACSEVMSKTNRARLQCLGCILTFKLLKNSRL